MDKKTLLAFLLIGLILILTQTDLYKSKVVPKRPTAIPDTTVFSDTLKKPEPIDNQKEKETAPEEKAEVLPEKLKPEEARKKENALFKSKTKTAPKEIIVNSSLYQAILSTKGGGVISWQLKRYRSSDSSAVELIPNVSHGVPSLGIVAERDSILFQSYNYDLTMEKQTPSGRIELDENNQSFAVSFFIEFQNNRRIEKRFVFYADKYDFDLVVTLHNFEDLTLDRSYQIIWDASIPPTEKPISDDLRYTKIYAYLGEDLQDFSISEKETELETKKVTGSVNWAALRTKYFVSSIVPMNEKGRSIIYEGMGIPYTPTQRFKYYNYSINMPLSERPNQKDSYKIYLGPLEYNRLKDMGLHLDKLIMSSGGYERLFRPFSIIILVALKFLHQFISNYGVVIIIFSLLIKLILYPLTHKSYVSMKKMQKIQPLMTEIREKYKNDTQRLNKEMMGLYKNYGVNPMGGCLPMLLQMPLLIGLFIVFRSTIELRGAYFMLWINDLSKPDTIFYLSFMLPLYGNQVSLLPILMGVTMFLQQKSTMQDPRQKAMAYFMPIFFVLLFNSFPSGLNLYYTLFNLMTIVQQKFIKMEDIELKPVEKKSRKSARNRKGVK